MRASSFLYSFFRLMRSKLSTKKWLEAFWKDEGIKGLYLGVNVGFRDKRCVFWYDLKRQNSVFIAL